MMLDKQTKRRGPYSASTLCMQFALSPLRFCLSHSPPLHAVALLGPHGARPPLHSWFAGSTCIFIFWLLMGSTLITLRHVCLQISLCLDALQFALSPLRFSLSLSPPLHAVVLLGPHGARPPLHSWFGGSMCILFASLLMDGSHSFLSATRLLANLISLAPSAHPRIRHSCLPRRARLEAWKFWGLGTPTPSRKQVDTGAKQGPNLQRASVALNPPAPNWRLNSWGPRGNT